MIYENRSSPNNYCCVVIISKNNSICFSPASRKKFVLFLIPCIKKIAMRTEDPVAEILAQTFPKIMQSFGHIMSDSNIKVSYENKL